MLLDALLVLGGCETPSVDAVETVSVIEDLEPLPVAEALYAVDQPGPDAERVTMLVWLRSLELSADQLRDFRAASEGLRQALLERDEALAAMREEQALAQAPVLAEWQAALLEGAEVPTLDLPRLDPRPLLTAYVVTALERAQPLVDGLGPAQRPGIVNALFLLRPRLAHEEYGGLLGNPWSDGDFATMRRSGSGPQDPLDPGGLFTLEEGAIQLTADLDGERLVLLVALALEHEQLIPAVDLLLAR